MRHMMSICTLMIVCSTLLIGCGPSREVKALSSDVGWLENRLETIRREQRSQGERIKALQAELLEIRCKTDQFDVEALGNGIILKPTGMGC